MTRRNFIAGVAAGAGAVAAGKAILAESGPPAARPNILWIVSEDNNPYLGCYGDKLARTPTLDGLAARGVLSENCFSQAPVCAPSRFTIITGMYPTCCGPAEHHRAQGRIPAFLRGFPAYLREAGYYCTNNAKTDYNAPIGMKDAWDESGTQAHWRKRPAGKPFFAVFNHEVTHESCLFPEEKSPPVTDPAKVRLPAYHPDTPVFRDDRARYYDKMAMLDGQAAKLLKQLEDDGVAEDTIVFYYGDNGGILPRSKRFCYDSGLHVPLIMVFPKKFQHLAPGAPGSRLDAPVSFIDLAPTILSLAGVEIPKYMQGHAMAGPKRAEPRQYAFCFRNRMDERYDFQRTVRDKRYRYIRNYAPHLIYGMYVDYMFKMRSMREWARLNKEGKLVGPQKLFWQEKPEEEFYDLHEDPDEVKNLIAAPEHQKRIAEMRVALREHLLTVRDTAFIPEGMPLEGYDASRDPKAYPLERILDECDVVTKRDPANLPKLIAWMDDENVCIRYWAALGCVMLREKAAPAAEALANRLADASAQVRIVAAEALCHVGQEARGLASLGDCLTSDPNAWVRLQAVNSLDHLGEKAGPALAALQKAGSDGNEWVQKAAAHVVSVIRGE